MIVDMISSLGRSVIKFFRALGRSGFMLFGALVGKPQIRQHFPLNKPESRIINKDCTPNTYNCFTNKGKC